MSINLTSQHGVRIAIEGCGHGTLHSIYASATEASKRAGWPGIDLVIIGGDFQAVRNAYDLNCVSMPAKYRSMCDFHEYYSGKRTAPYLTVFVGGNHEASNYLFELYYGGWVAPRMYYLGAANVLRLGSLRIAGLSGIWKGYSYRRPHFERLPYNDSDAKSIYHVRELDVRKLIQIRTQVDVGLSHDWPRGVEWKGDWKQLFRKKDLFEQDARNGQLGSVAAEKVLDWLRPKYWFSAHLHVKYPAFVKHEENAAQSNGKATNDGESTVVNQDEIDLDDDLPAKNADEIDLDMEDDETSGTNHTQTNGATSSKNTDEIDLDLDEEHTSAAIIQEPQKGPEAAPMLSSEAARAALPEAFRRPAKDSKQQETQETIERPSEISNTETHFLALDKCLPGRHFLQLMTVPIDDKSESDLDAMRPMKLSYDREWLSITRSFALNEPLVLGDPDANIPRAQSQSLYAAQIDKERSFVDANISDDDLIVPENFERVAPVYDGGIWNLPQYKQVLEHPNPQTEKFCEMLNIPNSFAISEDERMARLQAGPREDPQAAKFSGGRGRGRGRDGGFGGGGRGGGGGGRGGRGGGGRGGRGRGRGNFRGR